MSPERPAWAKVADVPDDPKFRWWQELRDVPSAWVTSWDETERFLYYDGPTRASSPIAATWNGDTILLQARRLFDKGYPDTADARPPRTRHALLIDARTKPLRALWPVFSTETPSNRVIDLTTEDWISGEKVEQSLLEILLERGLTSEESQGLIQSWRDAFFLTPGRRLLTFLTPEEYDEMLPLEIRPPATETVRVGIVVREFEE